mmetsp:Transcript_10371/g.33185  ORF Transcript_10371/g.33185 Transcript_10371/m.33185 type:complete len:108 (-) Transcript_10371:28-351(-)|eukprot:CAMPEP_0197388592 /NCGR_PEP_ID=MMETSP1165-20131217/1162_1 /TAXON_ID=284809 /ORGANISM="Chrysocystis fragilis, Strain CCMP3189" /LENGTH=107 /DNA_ID=CAMNT_0042913939 /DNA_START=53 /DNA_END=376 /DNA_ORIENTATION=+
MSGRLAEVLDSAAVQGTSGAVVGLTLVVLVGYAVRQRCRRRRHSYERVCHELDAEERDFKKALEGQAPDLPDLESTQFSDDETAQLEMIEKYRSSLLARDDDDETHV